MVLSSLYFYHIRWFLYFFFSHLMVPSSRCTVPTSHVTVLLSHSVAPLFFLTFYGYHPYIAQYQHHIWLYFCYIWWFLYFFFLTFDGTIFILRSTNITCDSTFVTFGGSLIFFLTFYGTILTLRNTNITCDCTFVTFGSSIILFLTFYGTSLTLHSTNITCCTFLDPLNTNWLTNYLAKWLT